MSFLSRKGYVLVSLLLLLAPSVGHATCSGAAAPIALQNFESNPAAWLAVNGKSPDLGAQVAALAAAAVNSKDSGFGAALSALLGSASADQGTIIGTALGTFGNTCSDVKDPNDVADKQYISTNIAPNLLANANANMAYGQASGLQTAAIGGVALSGGGTGVGGQTGSAGLPVGGVSAGLPPVGPVGVPTAPSGITTLSAASSAFVSP